MTMSKIIIVINLSKKPKLFHHRSMFDINNFYPNYAIIHVCTEKMRKMFCNPSSRCDF